MDDDRQKLLERFEGQRVTDVVDGLDGFGLIDFCTMDWQIRSLWRDTDQFEHSICCFAHTLHFVPTNHIAPRPIPLDEYKA